MLRFFDTICRIDRDTTQFNSRQLPALLSLLTLAVMGRVLANGFINLYDDFDYVLENRHVLDGLTWEGYKWAFTSFEAANWFPLTWLSHMLDVQLFGVHPFGHHLQSLLLHLANTVLLFTLLNRMTKSARPSFLVALLFAIHPQHVESVAWISERKDLLSTLFGFLAMHAYLRYTSSPGLARGIPVILLHAASLMAKPMLVTLPFMLLLLDIWPLKRWRKAGEGWGRTNTLLLIEKVPLLLLSVASSIITLKAQKEALVDALQNSLAHSIPTALLAYGAYLYKTFWPLNLAAFYPHPCIIPVWQPRLAGAVLLGVTIWVLFSLRSRPHQFVGWFWFIGSLVPVIGIIRVGDQASADRYTYLPLVGVFIMLAFGGEELLKRMAERWRPVLAGTVICMLFALSLLSWRQLGYWKNSETLFERTLLQTTDNWFAHAILGEALTERGNYSGAIRHFQEALRINPGSKTARYHLGIALFRNMNDKAAIEILSDLIKQYPTYTLPYFGLHRIFEVRKEPARALDVMEQGIKAVPDYAQFYQYAGVLQVSLGNLRNGEDAYRMAITLDPTLTEAYRELFHVLVQQGRVGEAENVAERLMSVNPGQGRDLKRSLGR